MVLVVGREVVRIWRILEEALSILEADPNDQSVRFGGGMGWVS